ncbi:hypothetical protein [Methanosarcina barkeri]|uniref:hypothetical protein n=1 Tax=Methanosarcina barkeri TaxID=2208 RepID=UPI00064EA88D|nr:hypothetical protein [Methanosarcina barkeri]
MTLIRIRVTDGSLTQQFFQNSIQIRLKNQDLKSGLIKKIKKEKLKKKIKKEKLKNTKNN